MDDSPREEGQTVEDDTEVKETSVPSSDPAPQPEVQQVP